MSFDDSDIAARIVGYFKSYKIKTKSNCKDFWQKIPKLEAPGSVHIITRGGGKKSKKKSKKGGKKTKKRY